MNDDPRPKGNTGWCWSVVSFVAVLLGHVTVRGNGTLIIGLVAVAAFWIGALVAQDDAFRFDDWLDRQYGPGSP